MQNTIFNLPVTANLMPRHTSRRLARMLFRSTSQHKAKFLEDAPHAHGTRFRARTTQTTSPHFIRPKHPDLTTTQSTHTLNDIAL